MPTFPADAPRVQITVFGTELTAPAPYAEGHVLTKLEAAFVSRAVAAAVANPFASALKKLKDAGKTDEIPTDLQKAYDDKYFTYEVGVRGSGESTSESTSPLDKMIRNLASAKLEALIIAKGRKPADLRAKSTVIDGKSAFVRNLEALIERDKEAFTAQAQANLDALVTSDDGELVA